MSDSELITADYIDNELTADQRTHGGSGELLAVTFFLIWWLVLPVLVLWGIGWSFYRHGPVYGCVAVVVPPYAAYRGVAAIWEEPKWKEKYETRTRQIAILVMHSMNTDPDWQMKSKEYLEKTRKWVGNLPAKERQHLKLTSREFGLATTEFAERFLLAMLDGESHPHPEMSAIIQERVRRFESVPGLYSAWQMMLQDTTSLTDMMQSLRRGEPESGLVQLSSFTTRPDHAITENGIRLTMRMMNSKIEQTVNDIFEEN